MNLYPKGKLSPAARPRVGLTSGPVAIFSSLMGNAPDSAKRLVDHFDQNRKVFLSSDYKEEQLPKAKPPHGLADSSRPKATAFSSEGTMRTANSLQPAAFGRWAGGIMRRIIVTGLLLTVAVASAQEYGEGFLTAYPGARQSAMAGVGAALAGTADGVFYNPAGPAFLKSPEAGVEVDRIPWMEPTDYWSAAGVVPLLRAFNAGVFTSGVHMTSGSEESDYYWEAGITASARVSDWLGFGLSFEYDGMHYSYLPVFQPPFDVIFTGSALAADAGVLARPHTCFGRPSIGIAVRNVGTRIKYSDQTATDALPALLDAGVGWTVTARELGFKRLPFSVPERFFPHDWLMDNWGASVFYDFRKVFLDDYPTHSVGVEVGPLPFLAARAGWFSSKSRNAPDDRKGLTWGVGLDLRYVRVDFCEDRNLFYLRTQKNYRFSFALNIGEPLLREGGLLGH